MIARIWRGRAKAGDAEHYRRHAIERVFPALKKFSGHRGAYLLTRGVEGEVEFLAVTFWESMDAIKSFAGANPDKAVIEPEARAVLSDFDDFVRHYEVVDAPLAFPGS